MGRCGVWESRERMPRTGTGPEFGLGGGRGWFNMLGEEKAHELRNLTVEKATYNVGHLFSVRVCPNRRRLDR